LRRLKSSPRFFPEAALAVAEANSIAERFVGTGRREVLDHHLVFGRGHVEMVLAELSSTITTPGRIKGWSSAGRGLGGAGARRSRR